MLRLLNSLGSILLACFLLPFQLAGAELSPVTPVMDCAQLEKADFSALAEAPLKVTSAKPIDDGRSAAYCQVLGYVPPQVRFEVRLPLSGWTQRFLQTGCGGTCGTLNVRVSNADGCLSAERGELALASTDMGHQGRDTAWGDDPQLRIDFAYRGVHVTALAAKALIEKFYGRKPAYSYFAGCSDGGREALMEAQRYPSDFNGITVGAPAMNFITQNTFYHGWNAVANSGPDGKPVLTADKLPVLHAAALAACDGIDGLKDGLIGDPRACRFDPGTAKCATGQDPSTCLTPAQVEVARELYRGAHDAQGLQLVISGPMPGAELGWRGVVVPNDPGQPTFGRTIATDTLKHLAWEKTPPASFSLNDFQFDQATFESLKPAHVLYDATDPDLSSFAKTGGKLILWHGWADQHISPLNTIAYYRALRDTMGEQAAATFARLYLFPGGSHCSGGEGPFNMNLLSPIMAWVERGIAPQALIASHKPPGPGERTRTRPVFPYPTLAVYRGSGSVDDVSSFEPKAPVQKLPETFDWFGAGFFRPVKALVPVRTTDLHANTHHVQGVEFDDSRVWVTSVDKALRRGFLQEFTAKGEHLRTVDITSGFRYHPGGISADAESLWVPVAEYRKASTSVVQKRNLQALELEHEFTVADHIGCVAAAPDFLIGANWDSRDLYVWDKSGRLIRKTPNPTTNAYQDMKFVEGRLVASGVLPDRTGAIDWLEYPSLRLVQRIVAGRTNRGIPYTQEGMAIRGERILFVPEDSPSRLFEFRLSNR